MSRRRKVIVLFTAVVGVLAVAAFVTWKVLLHDTATPASVADALTRYRAEAAAGETAIPQGVYVYRTTGSESISALGGTTHRYPRRSTITVTKAPCGMTLRWDVLTTRWNVWTVCGTGERSQRLDGWLEHHVFFGQDDETRWDCNGAPWLTDPSGVGTRTSQLCDGGDATQAGNVDVLDEVTIPVGGVPVQTIHMRVEAEEEGASRGPLVEERWVERETGLPVRIRYGVRTSNSSPIGDVSFEEGYDLRLVSLEPRR